MKTGLSINDICGLSDGETAEALTPEELAGVQGGWCIFGGFCFGPIEVPFDVPLEAPPPEVPYGPPLPPEQVPDAGAWGY